MALLVAGPRTGPAAQFKSGVTLVTIDVTVLDKDGQPVPGLTVNDFEVKLNGRIQPVRSLTFLQAAAESEMAGAVGPTFDAVTPALPRAAGTPASPAASTARAFVILVDDVSFPAGRGRNLFSAAQRFVSSLPSSDRVGFATTTGTKVINPTADRAPVRDALASVTGTYTDPRSTSLNGPGGKNAGPDQPVGIGQALSIDRGDAGALEEAIVRECLNGDRAGMLGQSLAQFIAENQCASTVQTEARRAAASIKQMVEQQLRAYASVVRAMQGAAGLKHLVILTDGVGLSQDVDALQPVARAAAEAGVQVTVIAETGDPSMTDEGRRDGGGRLQADIGAAQRRREDTAMFLNGAKTVADNLGAAFYNVVGSPDPFFERVRAAASAVYRLAVEPPADTTAGKDFALNARVKRAGLTVLANRRAVAGSPASATAPDASPRFTEESKRPLSVDEQLQRAIATGRAGNTLQLAIARGVRRGEDPTQVAVDIAVDLPASATAPLDTILGIVDARGGIRTSRKKVEATAAGEPYHIEASLPLSPGSYKLRFAVADASGAVGVVETAVEARLATMGTVAASELLRWTVNAAGERRRLAGEQIPADAKTLLLALELYPPADAPPDLLLKIALGPQGDAAANERIVTPELRDGVLIGEVEFGLAPLAPGAYIIRATVMSGATTLGTLSAAVRR